MPNEEDDIKFVFKEDDKTVITDNIEFVFDDEIKKKPVVNEPVVPTPPVPEVKLPETQVLPVEKWKPDDIQDNTDIPVKETEQEWDDTHLKMRRRIRVVVKTDPNKPTI